MSIEQATSRPSLVRLQLRLQGKRILGRWLMALYCIGLFLGLDVIYSNLTRGQEKERIARVADPVFDHGLAPNFDGHDVWGEVRYRLVTNSLGFKDGRVRDVPLKADGRRILLIGDSFTEAIGIPFEESFAGLLQRDGQQRAEKIEFLDAGVASYSPTVYYRKIRHLIEIGLQFDEVVLLSDSSDVEDEAHSYFCIDEDPRYSKFCSRAPGTDPAVSARRPDVLIDNFVITNRVRVLTKRWIRSVLGNRRRVVDKDNDRIGWATGRADPAKYQPLGVEGAIERSLQNMGKLSDLLASRGIPLTIVVYPWAQQIAQGDRDSRQVRLWRMFCATRCKAFVDLFPAFFAVADHDPDWYEKLYIVGDDHFSAAGNRLLHQELAKRILP